MTNVTISDIARQCGVSKATVSRVINEKPEGVGEETRRLVIKTMEQLNFRPNSIARSVATSRSGMVGLVIPDASNLFYPVIIRAVSDALDNCGYSMLLCNSDSDPRKEAKHLLSMVDRRVEGVILCSGVSNREFLARYDRYGVPLVAIGRAFDTDYSRASITGDNYSGARVATRFLIDGGNENIYYFDGDPGTAGAIGRRDGFLSVMAEAGRRVLPEQMQLKEYSHEFGFESVTRLLDEEKHISAVFAGSDLIAIGVVKALQARNIKVPEEVEVVGFDDIPLASMLEPSLTTVHKPHSEMARKAVDMLVDVIEGRLGELRHIIAESRLVIRDTTRLRQSTWHN